MVNDFLPVNKKKIIEIHFSTTAKPVAGLLINLLHVATLPHKRILLNTEKIAP